MADYIGATPQNPLLGLLYGGYDYLRSPQRTQQMQGLANFIESTGIPKTVERMSYGEPLTNIGQANVPALKPETAEAMMTVAPMAGSAARATAKVCKGLVVCLGKRWWTDLQLVGLCCLVYWLNLKQRCLLSIQTTLRHSQKE